MSEIEIDSDNKSNGKTDADAEAGYYSEIAELLRAYLARYPAESAQLEVLQRQLAKGDYQLNSRSNMTGHLTASALVLSEKGRCLLILHRALGRWLQPGGHLDPTEAPQAGALRELAEETGLILTANHGQPVDLDSHLIPASASKGEGEHLHHDFQYVFDVGDEDEASNLVACDRNEVNAFKWVSLQELGDGAYGSRLARVAKKLQNEDRLTLNARRLI